MILKVVINKCRRGLAVASAAMTIVAAGALGASCWDVETIPAVNDDPPEVQLGERLFRETRFSQLFFARAVDPNRALGEGDPALARTMRANGQSFVGPYAGFGMNCASCHLVDELDAVAGAGTRSYSDFARRSPIPAREDGRTLTPRNSPTMVDVTLARDHAMALHFDGEFGSIEDLVVGTLTGRNFGWLPTEHAIALAHVANVVRHDDGSSDAARPYGNLPYAMVLAGVDPRIPESMRIPAALRVDVTTASDEQVVAAIARLIGAYVDSLRFSRDASGAFDGSPYDRFRAKNELPRAPAAGETTLAYARRLRGAIDALSSPRWVSAREDTLRHHEHPFVFAERELAGLRTFLREPVTNLDEPTRARGGIGGCIACHTPPTFTDFSFHATGASQLEFDALHGAGAFAALPIPDLATRAANPARYLPPSPRHPDGLGPFLAIPSVDAVDHVDLGVWNVFGNDALPARQPMLRATLCASLLSGSESCDDDALLQRSIAAFKTPTVRDLGQSPPYLHNGAIDTIEGVVEHYVQASALARAGSLRNGARELSAIALIAQDVTEVAAFLRALDEDYE